MPVPRFLKSSVRALVRPLGVDLVRYKPDVELQEYPPDFEPLHISILNAVQDYTMTSPERIFSLIEAVRHITRLDIPGSIVECGVWRGGSMMAAALTMMDLKTQDRDLHLFDTFEGMPKPADIDVDYSGATAQERWESTPIGEDHSDFCRALLPDVQKAMTGTGYVKQKVHFHPGKVEDTIPFEAPDRIALLRLDTDWYESTRHELEHLYPRLSCGGILIIDDYGHWRGSRKATDEYIEKYAPSLFLNRIDYTGRIALKTI